MILNAENVGSIVRGERLALGLTQTKLAQRAGCSQRFVSELESGKASGEFAKVMAVLDALQLQVRIAPTTPADPMAEVSSVATEALAGAQPRKTRPRLADFLEAR